MVRQNVRGQECIALACDTHTAPSASTLPKHLSTPAVTHDQSSPLRNGDSSASAAISASIPARSSVRKLATARRRPVWAIQWAE